MNALLNHLKSLFPILQTRQAHEEAYLSAAADIGELERRMRSLEARGRGGWWAAPSPATSQVQP